MILLTTSYNTRIVTDNKSQSSLRTSKLNKNHQTVVSSSRDFNICQIHVEIIHI